jgi:two-component SAPR family response regulator
MCELTVSVKQIISALREHVQARPAPNSSTLLLLDMSWLLNTPSGIANQREFEVVLQELLETVSAHAICLYHRPSFPETMLLDALRTHPQVCTDEGPLRNPHYVPPAALLRGDAKVQLDAWMATLGPLTISAGADAREQKRADRDGLPAATEDEPSGFWPGSDALRKALVPPHSGRSGGTQQRWKIRCLGNLRVYSEDGSAVRWDLVRGATKKTKTLFALLLCSGEQGASAEELADLLWPDSQSTEQGLNRLYHTVHCLRIALEPHSASTLLQCRDHRYFLALPEGSWIDVPVFEQFCRRGEQLLRSGQLEDALACHLVAEKLYAGPMYADIPLKYIDNTEHDWCWSRRYWLEQMYIKMMTYTASIHRRLGHHDQTVSYAERALKLWPCHEPAHQEIMRSFHEVGRRDAFERQYRLCRDALRRFEDRAPSAETRVLHQNSNFS